MSEDSPTDSHAPRPKNVKSNSRPDATNSRHSSPFDRRNLLALISSGAVTSLAGCSGLIESVKKRTGLAGGPGEPAKQVDTNQNSTLNKRMSNRQEYDDATPKFKQTIEFSYDKVFISKEDGQFIAETLKDSPADRAIIQNPNGPSLQDQRNIILSTFGSPATDTYRTTNIDGQEVEFTGGSGDEIVVVGGIAHLQDVGRSLLVARGESKSGIDTALSGFNEFVSKQV